MVPMEKAEPIEQDRRVDHRMRCLRRVRLVFNHLSSTMDCLARNMTDNGARLIFDDPVALPRDFEVIVDAMGRRRKARLIWSIGHEAGVMFV